MPLLTSPIDGSPMKQLNRYGIEIDICPTSGGVWLDRGELEKLMAILKEEEAADMPYTGPKYKKVAHAQYRYDDDDDYYEKKHSGRYYKKKSKVEKLMDIFDF